jgi:hypothetical protein
MNRGVGKNLARGDLVARIFRVYRQTFFPKAMMDQCDAYEVLLFTLNYESHRQLSLILVDVRVDGGLIISLISELPNSMHDLLEIARYCFSGSPPCVVNHLVYMVMSKNMKKHSHLLFDTSTYVIFKQLSKLMFSLSC